MLPVIKNAFPGYSVRIKGSWNEILGDSLTQCGESGISVLFPKGAGWYECLAPGFEYCLDAPGFIPSGHHVAASYANVWD